MLEQSVVMIAGDSGDGIQLSGAQLTYSHALYGHIIQTANDFPAEIRAPAGTVHGVSGFQLCFSSREITTVGEQIDCLVVFNPAAYYVTSTKLSTGAVIFFDEDKWTQKDLEKAGYSANPLDKEARYYQGLPLTSLTIQACADLLDSHTAAKKNRNMTALGFVLWFHQLPLEPALLWVRGRFKSQPKVLRAAEACLNVGYNLGETLELSTPRVQVAQASSLAPGSYCHVNGNQAMILGLLAAIERSNRPIYLFGYPITPASDLLHYAKSWQSSHLYAVQAEDEMAACGMALGASYGGYMAVTSTSGPGFDLKSEMMGLGVSAELPLVVIDVQRAGPSTGMPTKTEQTDLLAALYGRHGECPIPVLAPYSPASCFEIIQTALLWARESMNPVIVLSDATLAHASAALPIKQALLDKGPVLRGPVEQLTDNVTHAFSRNEYGVRPWIVPGVAQGAHTLGGLEKEHNTGAISYDPENHEFMVNLRRRKVEQLARVMEFESQAVSRDVLVVCYGSVTGALQECMRQRQSDRIDLCVLTDLYPLPSNFWSIAKTYKFVVTVELSLGQLARYLRTYGEHQAIYSCEQVHGHGLELARVHHWLDEFFKEHVDVVA